MAEFQNYDLGRILTTAEALKASKRQAVTDDLRNQYMGVQMQNAQDSNARANEDQTSQKDTQDAKYKYLLAESAERDPDPVGFIKARAPELIKDYESHYGAGSFDQIQPDQLKGILGQIKAHNGARAGIEQPKAPVQWTSAPGPRGSVIQTNPETGEQRQVVGPDNSQPAAPEQIDPQSVENTAQMIAAGQLPALSGYALRTKWGQAVISRVGEINPQFAAQDYGTSAAALKQFTSGKNGNTVRSLNVAVQHLDQLGQLATALNNRDAQFVNKMANAWAAQTGDPAPTSFNAAKKVVGDEIVKAIVGAGGGVSDREEAAKSIDLANSPQQLAKTIETYQGLMTGQLNGLRQQYQTSTGRNDFERFLLPETRARLEKHGAQPAQPQSAPAQIRNDDDFNRLPSGAEFIAPDGSHRKKP